MRFASTESPTDEYDRRLAERRREASDGLLPTAAGSVLGLCLAADCSGGYCGLLPEPVWLAIAAAVLLCATAAAARAAVLTARAWPVLPWPTAIAGMLPWALLSAVATTCLVRALR